MGACRSGTAPRIASGPDGGFTMSDGSTRGDGTVGSGATIGSNGAIDADEGYVLDPPEDVIVNGGERP